MLKLRLFKQSEDGFCGPTSLRMVLDYHGFKTSEEEIINLIDDISGISCNPNGCNPEDLVKGAITLGFEAKFLKNLLLDDSIAKLKKVVNYEKIPVIVDWLSPLGDHYSVIVGIENGIIKYADPYYGKIKKIYRNDFLKHWLGYYNNPSRDQSDIFLRGMVVVRKK